MSGRLPQRAPKALAVSLALFLLASVLIVGSRPAAAVSGTLEVIQSGLKEPGPLAFASDGRVFFGERPTGKIWIIENGSVLPNPFYTFDNVSDYHDEGLLGLALDPSFPTTPWVYAYYTFKDGANATVYNRIVRVYATGNSGGSVEILLDRIPNGEWHIGGPIKFGPDGKLYALTGDTFVAANAQNLTNLAGKVLRLNPDGSVPGDNPFVGNASADPYIYTYGHRNLFGIAFHPVTGDVYVTENGPECNDEVNLLIPGRNYGWGANWTCSNPPPNPLNTNRDGPDPVLPLISYTPPIAPTNAIFQTGPSFAAWHGDFFFGTWNDRNVHRLHFAADYQTILSDDVIVTLPASDPYGVIGVGEALDGSIWFTGTTTIYRFYDTSAPPVASFTASSSTPLVGDVVTFNGSGSYDPDGSIQSYAWDFGDGSSASGAVVAHSFATFGTYYVTLVVTDFDNLSGSETVSIRVLATPTASFALGPLRPVEGTSVAFDATNSTDPDGNITDYAWDWGDGSAPTVSALPTAPHTFATFGLYTVNLTVTDSDGLSNETSAAVHVFAPPSAVLTFSPALPRGSQLVTFDGTGSTDADGTIVRYSWDFGDNTATATGSIVEHTFATGGNYSVSLTVTDSDGFTASASETVPVRPLHPPGATFTESATLVPPGIEVAFNASGSSDVDGTIVGYSWDFGDGTTGSGVTAVYAYAASGSYTVTLTVLDNDGLSSSASHVIVVNAPPIAAFAIFPLTPFVGDSVVFDGSASSDPEGSLAGFAWDFGDGTPTATGMNVSHAYAQSGTYVVVLQVTDSVGWTDTKSTSVVVRQNQPPVAVLAVTSSRVNPGDAVTFDASGSTDSDGSIVSYTWSFGDGATGQGITSVHAYATPGTYTVVLTVTDDRGASQTASGSVRVNAPPVASFGETPTSVYPGVYVTFNASGSADPDSPIVSYQWDFGDGTSAQEIVVVHAFAAHGSFVVRLVVTDDLGAANETTKTVLVGNRGPIIESTSPAAALVVNVSESTTFQVGAFDPDGDPLTYAWTVNGVSVGGSSPSYTFVGNATGTYLVKVVVSDGSAVTDFQWTVELQERAGPPISPWSLTSIALIGTGIGIALVVLLMVVLMMRRRRSH